MLAAIVFTDVVGFSRLAAQNESRVYVALQRDMGVITNLCRAHGGQVLNTMGDGMLLCFMSAVDAMTCAIEIQRTLFNQGKSLPASDVLHHRIGVHLGDVIMSGDNVFGDGVNVAARLQALAKPDAICFSHTVYEVIKNKLKIDEAQALGNSQLKNLGAPIKVWQVPAIQDSRRPVDLDDLPKRAEEGGASGMKAMVMVIVSVVLVGALIGAFTLIKVPAWAMKPKPKPEPAKTTTVPPDTTGTASGTTGTTAAPTNDIGPEIERLRGEKDFAGIVSLLQTAKNPPEAELKKLPDYTMLASLVEYLNGEMARADYSMPLRFSQVVYGQAQEGQLINPGGSGLQIKLRETDQFQPTSWAKMDPAVFYAVANALSENHLGNTGPAPPAVKAWVEIFAREYGVDTTPPAPTNG